MTAGRKPLRAMPVLGALYALSDYGFDLLMAVSMVAGVRCLRPVLPGSATLLMLAGIEAKAFTTVLVALTVLLMLMPGKLMLRATASPWSPQRQRLAGVFHAERDLQPANALD
jgi:hypothetical protein